MCLFENTIYERLLDALLVGDRVVVTSHLFYEFKTNSERVALAYQLLEEENLLPCLENVTKKSVKLAFGLRNKGNEAFQKKNDLVALQFYNRSLSAAPLCSKEYALAIGNRSAVYWSLGFLRACISDIDLALKSGYPNELRFKLIERQTKCFLQLGMKIEAGKAIKGIVAELQTVPQEKRKQYETSIKTLSEDLQHLEGMAGTTTSMYISSNQFGCSRRPSLSYGVNSEIECASSVITLKYSEDMGRHLVATQNINPGDVLIVEQPFASVLLPNATATHCYNCLTRCLSPVPCSLCTEVMFCDEKCRLEGWERFHSVDCSLLPVISKNVGKMGLLALRVLLLASHKGSRLKELFDEVEKVEAATETDPRTLGFNGEGHYVSTDYWPMHFLIGHSNRRANTDMFRRSVIAACLLHWLKNFTNFFGDDTIDDEEMFYFAGGLLLHHLQSLPCNAHEVSEMIVSAGSFESQEIGAACYATLSLLNHSCDPNVVRHSYGDWAALRAIRPIKAGEEVLDNYGYHHALHSVNERRSQLSKQYFFHCSCEACQGSWPPYKDQPTENPVLKCIECGAALTSNQNLMGRVRCSCGTVVELELLEENISKSSKLFRETLSHVLARDHQEEVPQSLQQHLILLANSVQRPWREFSECQETMKQCLSLQANHIILNL